jgi:hypothetical protein
MERRMRKEVSHVVSLNFFFFFFFKKDIQALKISLHVDIYTKKRLDRLMGA